MKNITILIILTLGFGNMIYSQTSEQPTYVILTSKAGFEHTEGVLRYLHPSYKEHAPLIFKLQSESKAYYVIFERLRAKGWGASTFPIEKTAIITKHKSFLQTITPVDLDVLLPTMTQEEAWLFGENLCNKEVYFIDRNDFQDGTIKLIQVKYLYNNRPRGDYNIIMN